MSNDLLFEIGTEELPSGSVFSLAEALMNLIVASFVKNNIHHGKARFFATPRRLAVLIESVALVQDDQPISRRGPAVLQAHDTEGKPTQALIGFAKSCGVTIDALTILTTDKGAWWTFDAVKKGTKTCDLIPELLNHAVTHLPIAKTMRWGGGDVLFARPVHWVVLLFGNEVIDTTILGLKTGRLSFGHRFHHPQSIEISSPSEYELLLKNAFVIADFNKRQHMIESQIKTIAASEKKQVVMPQALLDEVTSIVEWPNALLAEFDSSFLDVPKEALIAAMQSHQKSFALCDDHGTLTPCFITVANIDSTEPQRVISGNEKVMRARLSDAAFFFRQDKKQALSHYVARTKQVVYQAKLGTLNDKSARIGALMAHLVSLFKLNAKHAERVAYLSKCDLMTGMVGEFPELQGLMGYYYAKHDREDETVAIALNEQYMPRFSKDDLPASDLGRALSLADRMDTLVGTFAIGQKPTGVKDPFKSRRNALAVVRLLVSSPVAITLSALIHQAQVGFDSQMNMALVATLKPFILDRMLSFYQAEGVRADFVHAVLTRQNDWLYDADKRIEALNQFIHLPEALALASACKRVNNILQQQSIEDYQHDLVNEALLHESYEEALYKAIQSVETKVKPYYQTQDYDLILSELACLQNPVDAFFEHVMVMTNDTAIKENRLRLLARLNTLLQGVADISLLQVT